MLPASGLYNWDLLSNDVQLRLAQEAMRRAAQTFAAHAELLAGEMEAGEIADHGGPGALRLLATMVRLTDQGALAPAGTA